mgnify:CR=1 FL=1|jgi:hypothetical protein
MTTITEARDAIWEIVVDASALGEAQVVFADQDGRPADGAYITISTSGPVNVAGPKGEVATFDATAALGEEVTLTAEGHAILEIQLQAFDLENGAGAALELLNTVQIGLQLSTRRATLREGGVAIFDFGDVTNLAATYGPNFEARAALDMRAHIVQSATAQVGYVSRVEGVLTLNDASGDAVATQDFEGEV